MTLGEWIDTLAAMPADAHVLMDCGTVPTHLCSWRGVYAELTLDHDPGEEGPTVTQLLADARAADGGTFTGYKGGDFTMSGDTPVWADEYGDYTRRMIVGVVLSGESVVVKTLVIPIEY